MKLREKTMSRGTKWLLQSLFVLVVFTAGVGIGNGRLHAGRLSELARNEMGSVQHDLPKDLSYDSVEKVYDELRQNYDGELDVNQLLDGLKLGLANAAGDPYTEYMNSETAEEFSDQLDGTFTGIGAELSKDAEGNIVVIAPISGSPAEKAGLKPKDVIAEIDGNSTYGMAVNDAVQRIRGDVGTKVTLKIVRNQSDVMNIEITRAQIKVPSVESKVLDGNIGYLRISRFSSDTTRLATQAATEFKQKNVRGVIVDVRSNPGGLVDSAVDVASLWLENGATILQEKRGDEVIKTYTAKGQNPLHGIPTIMLLNEGSASASEILAGALRDNKAATLYGVKSFGKGKVQRVIDLGDGSVLKVTIAKWFTPQGVNIDKEGIQPDKEVKLTDEDAKNQRDPQLDAAKQSLQ